MKTLIELYDERPLENVLSTEMFRPERTVYICSAEVGEREKRALRDYFAHRGVDFNPEYVKADKYSSKDVYNCLKNVVDRYPDCALDVSGGTDNALFAAGQLSAACQIPVFTYSRRQNRFYSISGADFADKLDCTLKYTVEDFFMMTGGSMRTGRVDNAVLDSYMSYFDGFFRLYLKYRRDWGGIVNYMQRVSQVPKEQPIPLEVCGDYTVKGEHGRRIAANENALSELEKLGFIEKLEIKRGQSVSFRFMDHQVRTWLRDVGSVLELYVYKLCVDAGVFDDVRTSAVVDWESNVRRDSVTNEIDVMAVRDVTPMFISCKTCEVNTEALNELAILRDRFGGQGAKAAIVTTKTSAVVTRNRATELGIEVIDLTDLKKGSAGKRIAALAKRLD
ncbi:MAG: DUF1887 family protein [Oscillospiraceae bacterium]|nr:DUF1887 family protein [Oscillospiraceae bacterium]